MQMKNLDAAAKSGTAILSKANIKDGIRGPLASSEAPRQFTPTGELRGDIL